MRSVRLTVRVQDSDAATVFERIRDFARYPELVDVVRAVTVHPLSDQEESSDWEVYFRNGILRWTEADRIDPVERTIAFVQLDGDFDVFCGDWRISSHPDGCQVAFAAEFDFGIPSLAEILDPIAARVLKETIARIVISLFGSASVLGDDALAKAVATVPALSEGVR